MDPQPSSNSERVDNQSVKAKSTAPNQGQVSDKAARLIANSSSIFYALFIVIVAVDALPLRLLDPLWFIQTATSLTNTVSFPLAGLFFLHISAALSPLNSAINQRLLLLSRLAVWAALAYLLLIPLLGFAVWRGIANVKQESARQISGVSRNADRLVAAIDRAKTAKELQSSMEQLQGPKIADQDFEIPLDQIKTRLKKIVSQLRQKFIAELPQPNSEAFKPIYVQAMRASALALVSSIGFASLSWDPLKQQTLLQKLLSPPNKASLSPAGLSKKITKAVTPLLAPFKPDPSKESRKRFWSQLRDKEKRASAMRAKEIKRNAEKLRRAQQERERQRRLQERKRERERQRNRRRSGDDDDS